MKEEKVYMMIKCKECGTEVSSRANSCVKCGYVINRVSTSPKKSPGVAAVLNFLWSGVGNIYIGQIGGGLIASIVYLALNIAVFVSAGNDIKEAQQQQQRQAMNQLARGNYSKAFEQSLNSNPDLSLSAPTVLLGIGTFLFWGVMLFTVYNSAKKMNETNE